VRRSAVLQRYASDLLSLSFCKCIDPDARVLLTAEVREIQLMRGAPANDALKPSGAREDASGCAPAGREKPWQAPLAIDPESPAA
jgi:hypothetical protein